MVMVKLRDLLHWFTFYIFAYMNNVIFELPAAINVSFLFGLLVRFLLSELLTIDFDLGVVYSLHSWAIGCFKHRVLWIVKAFGLFIDNAEGSKDSNLILADLLRGIDIDKIDSVSINNNRCW